jgi:transcription initiation factor TFIIIB Brf1 subunit/transcription initiation factor TFIIB
LTGLKGCTDGVHITTIPIMTDFLPCPCEPCTGFGTPDVIDNSYTCIACSTTFYVEPTKKRTNNECKNCGSNELITISDQGDIVCKCCSFVHNTIVSDDQEWNNYVAGVNNSRVGMASNNPFTKLGSTIHANNSNRYDPLIRSMFICNNNNSEEKAYDSVNKIIDTYEDVPIKVRLRAKQYWEAILRSDGYATHRGSVRSGILFSMIFFAANEMGIPMTVNEISECTGLSKGDMNKGEMIFIQMISRTKYAFVPEYQLDITKIFERYLDHFHFSDTHNSKIKFAFSKICRKIYLEFGEFFENRNNITVIGGVILYVLNNFKFYNGKKLKKVKLSEIEGATSVSAATINKVVKTLNNNGVCASNYDDVSFLKSQLK